MDEAELINEVLGLALACHAGTATAEERARLERLLVDDPRAIGWYLRIVDDTLTLRDAAAAQANSASAANATEIAAPAEPAVQSKNSVFLFNSYRKLLWTCAAIACLVPVALTIGLWRTPLNKTDVVQSGKADFARIIEVTNVKWSDGAPHYDEWSSIKPGARLQFNSGWLTLFFSNGAELVIEGPADVRYDSSQKVFARKGKLAARIGPDAIGFRIETPHANVIDRGTEFGISVDGDSHTSVVVYKGVVDMDLAGDATRRRRLETGEALSVDRDGQLSRITTVGSNEFLEPPQLRFGGNLQSRLIASVTDNVRSLETAKYYRVISRGFHEDCQAYVDRMHQWNGVDRNGLPPFLLGGDYVMTFNDDKIVNQIEITLSISRPSIVYVLFDDRVEPPDWLTRDFVNTKWKVGSDEGYDNRPIPIAEGAGQSIDHVFSVWMRKVHNASTVMFGPLTHEPTPPTVGIKAERSMYGIVVTPMRANRPE